MQRWEVDAAILRAAAELIGRCGVHALTYEAVADSAGTSRPAIYRRYGSLTELAVDALGVVARTAGAERTGDPLTDLAAELLAFRSAILRVGGINVAASILLDTTDEKIKRTYRERVVGPRRARLRDILDDAQDAGRIAAGAGDRALAVTMCVGSWYAHVLAGTDPPPDWPQRTAALAWRSLGGEAG